KTGLVTLGRAVVIKPPDKPMPDRTMPDPEEVSFTTADGVTLRGTLYPSPKGKRGATVLMVPEPSTLFSRKDDNQVRLARKLQKLDCSVLTFDFRGFGENAKGLDALAFNSFWTWPANKYLLTQLKKSGAARFGNPTVLAGSQ